MKRMVKKVENKGYSTREYIFLGWILFLSGLLIGIFASPKGERTIGCDNGNNNGNNNSGCMTE